MKINQNQKSVLTLFLVVFVGLLAAHANIFSIEMIVFWLILAAWFYGVRDKTKPAPQVPPETPGTN